MRKKKDLPLVILKALEDFVHLKGEKFEIIDPKESLMKVVDKDEHSTFSFTIERYQKHNNGTFQFLMMRSPRNINDNGTHQTWVEIAQLKPQFESWIKLLDDYETVPSFYDDPILKTFTDEYYSEFEIIEEDADFAPFKTKQILLLDEYLEKLKEDLSSHVNEENSIQIEEIRKDIQILRENLTSRAKSWVVKKLSKICAKVAKQGTPLIKEFLSETKKEIIKEGIKGAIEYVKIHGHTLL